MIAEQNSDLEKYYRLKKDVDLPVKVRLFFLIFENALDQNKAPKTIQEKKGFSKALLNAFSNLSTNEKGQYLLNSISFVLQQQDRQEKEKTKADSKFQSDQIRNIETTCQMLLSALKINYWTTVSLKLDKMKKLVSVTNKKKSFSIDMKNYFVRKSKKYKHSVVLEAITQEINNQAKKYVFCFNHYTVNKIHEELLKCCFLCQNEKILSLMVEDEDEERDEKYAHQTNQKAFVFLSSKNINDYLSYKEKVQKQIMQHKFEFRNLFNQGQLKIEHSSKYDKIFKMQNTFQIDSKQLKQKFLYAFDNSNKFVIDYQILQDFSKKYKAVYQKLSVNGRTYEHISIREQSLSGQEEILFVKGIQNIMGKNYIQFIQVRVRTVSPCVSRLIIYMSIGLNAVITKEVVKYLMIQFNQMVFRKKQKMEEKLTTEQNQNGNQEDYQDDDEFKTVKGSDQFVGFIEDDGDIDGGQGVLVQNQVVHHREEKNTNQKVKQGYLFVKHDEGPIDEQKYHQYMKQHYLWKQWIRVKKGGVLCTDEAIVTSQKKVFKEGIAKLGRNILKGQILRLSMPIVIFRKESHLETIARNFCFAPMFFDRFQKGGDPLERLKYATLLAVSVGTLGISMQKPFNPTIGQTMQLRIDGCPIYLEQISHHPAIGAYYLYGRGYRLYGQVQPKVNFGLNNVKGFSTRPNYLVFDDGSEIEISFGKMLISGLLFGDRQFNFEDKIFAYDKKNHIFSQVVYGPRKKHAKHKHDPLDFFYGRIYKVKPEFLPRFNNSMPRILPNSQEILQQLSNFEGIWNDQVRFDGKVYIDFRKDLPFEIIHQENPLPSNSSYRTDLNTLITGTLQEAQRQKDRLEDAQRRDRKLRQKYHK